MGYGPAMPDRPDPGENRDGAAQRTHFGFRQVLESEKPDLVRAVFNSVAPRYDLANDLMSAGIHRLWKAALMDDLNPRPGMTLIDVGGGTGDMAMRFLERGGGAVRVVDANARMLRTGRDRTWDRGLVAGIGWVCGDAESLPIAERSVDAYVTAFCLRNVTRLEAALAEARRVLRPGGRFLCLEFSHVVLPLLADLYDAYSFRVLPWIAGLATGDKEAYVYLVESIRRFPDQKAFQRLIADAGLERARHRNLSGGIAAIHSAWRL